MRSELERRRAELGEAERLCEELSAIVAEPYLREELSKRLEAVGAPLRSLEERAGKGGVVMMMIGTWSLLFFFIHKYRLTAQQYNKAQR